ncbi:MAG: hydroxymethylglutaryl-CoA reductase [Saprospiraceae bacterium]
MKIPRNKKDDYTEDIISKRQIFLAKQTNKGAFHLHKYSFNPQVTEGNIENFIGVAQVPIGLAGPLLVNGEHAKGQFLIPMATTEGTLVASYNRGMKLCSALGGVKTTVIEDKMNRAPVFVFEDARYARDFGLWIKEHYKKIKEISENTSSIVKLIEIEQYTASKMIWLRFSYSTGDAAGQNMVTKATREACNWILTKKPKKLEKFSLAANFDTDKKHSYINYIKTRGKRVVAEIIIPHKLIKENFRVDAKAMAYQRGLSTTGALLSGSINNGAHSANAITAMFIACGQDVANVAESSAAIIYPEILDNGDYYFSITIPSLIVATYGGGTSLPTQRECLEIMDCYGDGKVNKFAEIVAATVLCGELSLSAAILADEWVASHEQLGRNR